MVVFQIGSEHSIVILLGLNVYLFDCIFKNIIIYRVFPNTIGCSSSLGLEDGRIPRVSLATSSSFKIAHWPHFLSADLGRLNGQYAWCSQEQKFKMVGEYFQVTFDKFTRISGVATQVR